MDYYDFNKRNQSKINSLQVDCMGFAHVVLKNGENFYAADPEEAQVKLDALLKGEEK